jgi:hypothetical protein
LATFPRTFPSDNIHAVEPTREALQNAISICKGFAMSQGALINWKQKCGAIHTEMDRLLSAGWLETAQERQVRQVQFRALIERRNVAASDFLKSGGGGPRFSVARQKPPRTPAVSPVGDQKLAAVRGEILRQPSKAALEIHRSPRAEPTDPLFEARNFLKHLGLN